MLQQHTERVRSPEEGTRSLCVRGPFGVKGRSYGQLES